MRQGDLVTGVRLLVVIILNTEAAADGAADYMTVILPCITVASSLTYLNDVLSFKVLFIMVELHKLD